MGDLKQRIERDRLHVCPYCLMAIESREGRQATFAHYYDEDDDPAECTCDWCDEESDVLYELL